MFVTLQNTGRAPLQTSRYEHDILILKTTNSTEHSYHVAITTYIIFVKPDQARAYYPM
jgi:hypothetical protein